MTALRKTGGRVAVYAKHQELKQAGKQASATSKTHVTSRSLLTAEALGKIVGLVAIRVQVELGCLLLVTAFSGSPWRSHHPKTASFLVESMLIYTDRRRSLILLAATFWMLRCMIVGGMYLVAIFDSCIR